MKYARLNPTDIANGIGVRVSLFVSGCDRHCPGCHNEDTWDFNYGAWFKETTMHRILSRLDEDFIDGLTILGGEPLHPNNIDTVREIVKRVREEYPEKTIWIYTGYTYEELDTDILQMIDVLVDGAFIESMHDITLKFRGSSNQRIIDVPATLAAGEIILWRET